MKRTRLRIRLAGREMHELAQRADALVTELCDDATIKFTTAAGTEWLEDQEDLAACGDIPCLRKRS